ncbi:hypothetical protein BCR44DRAFT_1423058 [Catenaria anguillulae PL171]|uniref:Radial spoke head 1 homolog n=1 Tax=Catenaria anguillulae PL171 TaxID=765915 RepID=A0A1Y2I3V5_9FUNG|nr:hypothetical protein BCR44DRAFT_1423058 [Catenaria anguillulae PL171]
MSDTGSNADPQEQPPSIGVHLRRRTAATGERHGRGRMTWPNGDVYDGNYTGGKRQGQGMYTWKKPKSRYVGEYHDNMRHGQGAMVYPDGSRYKGQWQNGRRHGKGVYVYPNADVYEGEWVEDMKQGEGVYTFVTTGSKIKGIWDKNFLQGPATILHADHSVSCTYEHVKETVPVNPEDETQGTKEVIKGSVLKLPSTLHFNSSGFEVKSHWIGEQVGLGPAVVAGGEEE